MIGLRLSGATLAVREDVLSDTNSASSVSLPDLSARSVGTPDGICMPDLSAVGVMIGMPADIWTIASCAATCDYCGKGDCGDEFADGGCVHFRVPF